MPEKYIETRPGFQGSETSWIDATFYRHGDDPIVLTKAERLITSGRRPQDKIPSLVSATSTKAMGSPSGSFQLVMKPSIVTESLFDQLVDDDWVDIIVYRHNQPWHVMRGMVDEIRRTKTVGGAGATSEMFLVSGRDFAKVWETTPVWFSPYANDIVTQAVANKVFQARPGVLGNPGEVVWSFLRSFLEEIADAEGPNWEPPNGVPGTYRGDSFLDSIVFRVGSPYFQNLPKRKAFNPGFMHPQGTLWSLAQQFSDPMFTELYVDMLPDADPFSPKIESGDSLLPKDMTMTVVLRDKPFPVVDPELTSSLSYQHSWKNLPVLVIPRQQIVSSDLGRSGLERFNAFFVAPVIHQELMRADALYIMAPLMEKKPRQDLKRHGLRRLDAKLNQSPDPSVLDWVGMAEYQRRLLKDWYILNPYMLNGSIDLGIGRPDIRIGCRVRVPASQDRSQRHFIKEENYYVEQVTHTWMFGTSVKTTLGVTRGWRGDDDSYIGALETQSSKYDVPLLKKDSEVTSG